jgi:hypothetical protein
MTSYRVNRAAVDRARALIDDGRYDDRTPWSEAAPSTERENEEIERAGYDGYGEWHLAEDPGASAETKGRYAFPYGDFEKVNRAALIHAEQRAVQNDHDEIARAAKQLLERLDERRERA